MLRMASMLRGGGLGGASPFGAPPPAFPAPGTPNAQASSPSTAQNATPVAGAGSPPAGSPPADPFGLFGGLNPGAAAGSPGVNPFGYNPALMQQILGLSGGLGASPPPPADTRPPEERFQVQLQVSLLGQNYVIHSTPC